MLRSFLLLLALLSGPNALAAPAADTPPDVLARTTTQEVLTILKQDKELQNGNLSKVYQLVEAKILPNFDFNRMTQLALGKHWPRATAKQKQSLVAEFRNLLVRTYSSSLTAFSNQTVEFKPLAMKPGDTDVTVRSEVRQPGGQPIPIDYAMYKTDFGWKVYDVTIDSVSLVTNYRASFSNTIRQSGIDGLIKTLATQSARGEAKPAPRPAP
ncbi:MAG: ABC transporter substrate-binding protein [Gammaproteobacteria bacterium]|jgi:phospholipid transport system substrate-binding protein|nr:ABC transporter substrate-binding protein [Gammaproteobacteria bacterium]MBU1407364.1 ABC transporter substrate-binding protein [Gammaproteobacteria bacterium]MBU1531477.1 ABC transporter substrate-binding protein [Gammaproteobacteria bacterium]